jgi:hypothetical protein
MAKKGLVDLEIDYLVKSILDSGHVTSNFTGLDIQDFADNSARKTLEEFRFGLNSFNRESRRMQYPLPVVKDCNPRSFSAPEDRDHIYSIVLTTLLKTELTAYKPFEWHQNLKDRKTAREIAAPKPVSPETMAREFRRVLLMPNPEGLQDDLVEKINFARELIGESHKQGYQFGLLGSFRKSEHSGEVVSQAPILFLPGVNYSKPCDGVDSPFRFLDSLGAFCNLYAFEKKNN